MQIPLEVRSCTPSTATATNVSSVALAANSKRRSAIIVNADADTDVYLARGATAESGKGILLKAAGGAYEINSTNLFKGVINCITASGSAVLTVEEGI